MKTGIFCFTLLLSAVSFSQTDKEITKVADLTCDCIKSKNLEAGDMDQLQVELGICMLGAMNDAGVEMDVSSMNDMEELGERVGLKLAFSCPEFMELIGEVATENPDEFDELINDFSTSVVFGEVTEVNSNEFVSVKIINEDGRKQTFYWFEHFEGAELLNNGGKGLIGKQVSIVYYEMEYYSPKLDDYTNLKVLSGIEIE